MDNKLDIKIVSEHKLEIDFKLLNIGFINNVLSNSVVEGFLNSFGKENLVLGGTSALVLHGLELGRLIDDIDFIVFKPTQNQLQLLSLFSPFDTNTYNKYDKRSFKYDIQGYHINIIVSNTAMPLNLLKYGEYFINAISNVIDAKASYLKGTANGLYGRLKDFMDCENLKNLNFNLTK